MVWITLEDALSVPNLGRRPGFCLPGIFLFLDHHGIPRSLVENGIESEDLLRLTNHNAMIQYLVRHVERRIEEHG